MEIELDQLSANQVYFTLTQTLIPRPIAWVLSDNGTGDYNLAPFSYFNAVCSDPPLMMLSIGKKPDGSHKDTRVNIEQRRHYVIHLPHLDQLDAVNESAATLEHGDSELTRLGLETVPFADFPLPRLKDCRIAFGCECYEIQEIGGVPQSLILGRVHRIHIADEVVSEDAKGRMKVHADRIEPLSRLGATEYGALGKIIAAKRPG